ncbi:MAG: hypothetical protein IPL46_26485 [Saprospiraceae bacterium]|nr:hypothetical protein [Saprospiraceae bacterium]
MKNLIRSVGILALMPFLNSTLQGQTPMCGTGTGIGCGYSYSSLNGCDDWEDYVVDNMASTPLKTLRITFHIFRPSNGSAGLPDDQSTRSYITAIADQIASRFSNPSPYDGTSNSPYYSDTRIRIQLTGIYFWNDDLGWAYQHITCSYKDAMWTNIQNKSFPYKTTSLNIISGNCDNNSIGWAPYVNNDNDQLVFYPDLDDKYNDIVNGSRNTWQPAQTIAHEIGHVLSLAHPNWNTGKCNDVQALLYGTNNLMGYEGSNDAFTLCQIHRMHHAIWRNFKGVKDYVSTGATSSAQLTPSISGATCLNTSGQLYEVTNYPFGAEPSWSGTPSNKLILSSGCGPDAQIASNSSSNSGTGSISFTLKYNTTSKSNSKSFTFSSGITGTVISGGVSTPLGTSHAVSSTAVSANIDAPGATSFTWTKTSGSGSWYTYNNGKSLSLTLSTNGQISYNISTATSTCGPLSKNVTIFHTGGYYSFYPNPTTGDLYVEVLEDEIEIDVAGDDGAFKKETIKLGIEKLTLLDKNGNQLKEVKVNNGSMQATISLAGLTPDVYFAVVKDGDRLIESKIIKN